MDSKSQLPAEALAEAAEAAYEFYANLVVLRSDPGTPWMKLWAELSPSDRADWRAILEAALPAIISADRHELVKWMHAESGRLEEMEPELTSRQIFNRAKTSQALIAAIAHMSAYGQDGQAKMTITITDGPGNMPAGRMLDEQAAAEREHG